MKVLSKPRYSGHRGIGDESAFLQYQIPEAWRHIDNLLHGGVGESGTRCQVEDAQMFKRSVRGNAEEGIVVNQFAAG